MSDEPATPSGFSTAAILVLVLATATVTVGAGLAFESGQFPGAPGNNETAELTRLQTFDPRCGTHRSSNSSTDVRPTGDGVAISVNGTVPVAARDSDLDADLETVGPDRYLLDLQRTAGNRSTDCYLEMGYNATVTLPDRTEYTLIRTVDRTYHAVEYGDQQSGGSSGPDIDLRPPSMTDAEWSAALNASDEHFYNESRSQGSS